MNDFAKTFTVAIASVAAAAAIGVGLADRTATPVAGVVTLERVVIVGKRAEVPVVAKLPRVVIEHRRDTTTVASAQPVVWLV